MLTIEDKYVWNAPLSKEMQLVDIQLNSNTTTFRLEGDRLVLDFSLIDSFGENDVEVTGNYELINSLTDFLAENNRFSFDGKIVRIDPNNIYLTYELDNSDNLVSTVHVHLQLEQEKWVAYLEEMSQINAPHNLHWVGHDFHQEQ